MSSVGIPFYSSFVLDYEANYPGTAKNLLIINGMNINSFSA